MTTSGETTTFWPMLQPRPILAPRHDVAEVPDLRAVADLAAVVDERRRDEPCKSATQRHLCELADGARPRRRRPPASVGSRCASSIDGRASSMPKPRPASTSSVDAGVQVGEAFGELDLLAVDGDRAERRLAARAAARTAGRPVRPTGTSARRARSSSRQPAMRFVLAQVHLGRRSARRTARAAGRRSECRCSWRCRPIDPRGPSTTRRTTAARGDVGQADLVAAALAGRRRGASCSAIRAGCSAQLQHGVDAPCRSPARAPAARRGSTG